MSCGRALGRAIMTRVLAFIIMLLIYSAFTLIGAFAPSAAWLTASRFFAGIGIGAEIVVIDTYVSEMVPSHARGRFVAITQVIGFTSVPTVALLSRVLVPTHFLISGWRWVMVIGAAGANATIDCPASPTFTAPTASDSCNSATVTQVGNDTTVNGTCTGTYTETRAWRATDACGNTSGTVTQMITVRDNTPPVIGTVSDATIDCPASPTFTAPTR